ncbi:unnamed protein product [Sphacelaria rigidula]
MRLLAAEVCLAAALGNSSSGGKINMMTAAAGVPPPSTSPPPPLKRAVTGACSNAGNGLVSNDDPLSRNVIIRTARLSEAKHLTAIINDAFQVCAFLKKDGCADRVTADGKQVEDLIKKPCCAFLVAEEVRTAHDNEPAGAHDSGSSECKEVLGCVHINWSGTANCGRKVPEVDAIFGMLSVKPEHTRRGIGQLLVASAERRCREELGRDYVMEISIVRSQLLKWYQDQGYVPSRQIPFPVPDLIKEGLDVKFQLLTKRIP